MAVKSEAKASILIDKNAYEKTCLKYRELGSNLKKTLKSLLTDAEIDYLDIQYRIKEYDSFNDKIERKRYSDPLGELEDICGLRIICFYPSDISRIEKILKKEFNVVNSIDKSDALGSNAFGYRSKHFVITIKDDWASIPNYRNLKGLKAEIQLRTVLMHAWADVEHKLAYKKKEYIPQQLKRKLYRLSALFELADEQFDQLRQEKHKYIESLIPKKNKDFDVNQQMNLDSLQAFLDFYLPDRDKSLQDTLRLLEQLLRLDISFKNILEEYKDIKKNLPEIQKDFESNFGKNPNWAQTGIIRLVLDLANDKYWLARKSYLPAKYAGFVEKWRGRKKSDFRGMNRA